MVHPQIKDILDAWKLVPTFVKPGAKNNKNWSVTIDLGPGSSVKIEVENSSEFQYPTIEDDEYRDVWRNIFTYRKTAGFTLSPTLNDYYPLEDDISRLVRFLEAFNQDFLDHHELFYRGFSSNYHSDLKKIPNQ